MTISGVHCTDNGFKGLDFKYTPQWTGEDGKGAGYVGRVTIQGCHMHDNGHAGCSISNANSDEFPAVPHFIIEGNQAHRNGDHGFYCILRESVVSHNIARENANRGFNFLSCSDVVISGNVAVDNCRDRSTEAFGFYLEPNGTRSPPNRRLTVQGNIARRSDPAGRQVEGFVLHSARIEDSVFAGNIASGHERNIVLVGMPRNVEVTGNHAG